MRLLSALKNESWTVGLEAAEEVVVEVLLRGVVGEPEGCPLGAADLEDGGFTDVEAAVLLLEGGFTVAVFARLGGVIVVDDAAVVLTDLESGEDVAVGMDSVEFAIAGLADASPELLEAAGCPDSVTV